MKPKTRPLARGPGGFQQSMAWHGMAEQSRAEQGRAWAGMVDGGSGWTIRESPAMLIMRLAAPWPPPPSISRPLNPRQYRQAGAGRASRRERPDRVDRWGPAITVGTDEAAQQRRCYLPKGAVACNPRRQNTVAVPERSVIGLDSSQSTDPPRLGPGGQ